MAVNSKQKGNAFERKTANTLSARFKDFLGVEKGFIRHSDSGAYFGGKNSSRTETHLAEIQTFGDILCPKHFRWTIEAKNYKDPLTLNAILTQQSKQLDDWIAQAEQDANHANRHALLVIKFNQCEPFVLLTEIYPEIKFLYKNYRAYRFDYFLSFPDNHYFLETNN